MGRSPPSVGVDSMLASTSIPAVTLPKTGWPAGPGGEPVETVVVDRVDEELAASAVRLPGVGHRQCAGLVRELGVVRVFVLEMAVGAVAGSRARAVRVLAVRTAELDMKS